MGKCRNSWHQKKSPPQKRRKEDRESDLLFRLKVVYDSKGEQMQITLDNIPRASIEGIKDNLGLIQYHIKEVSKINFNIDAETTCLVKHVQRTRAEKNLCRFFKSQCEICESWLDCNYRQWDAETNLPTCALYKDKIIAMNF